MSDSQKSRTWDRGLRASVNGRQEKCSNKPYSGLTYTEDPLGIVPNSRSLIPIKSNTLILCILRSLGGKRIYLTSDE